MGLGAVKAAGKMEQLEIAFTTMLGNAEQAKTMLSDLQDFAQVTPFDLESVTNGSRRLLAMGFSAEQIIPVMTARWRRRSGSWHASRGHRPDNACHGPNGRQRQSVG